MFALPAISIIASAAIQEGAATARQDITAIMGDAVVAWLSVLIARQVRAALPVITIINSQMESASQEIAALVQLRSVLIVRVTPLVMLSALQAALNAPTTKAQYIARIPWVAMLLIQRAVSSNAVTAVPLAQA
jgi:hypothetical protein